MSETIAEIRDLTEAEKLATKGYPDVGQLNAYYYSFEATGVPEADAVEKAGRAVDALYGDLETAHPHPFDWIAVLHKPPILHRRKMAGWKKNCSVFAAHGFVLTERLADRFRLSDSQRMDEDCGGAIVRRLTYALDGQITTMAVLDALLGDAP